MKMTKEKPLELRDKESLSVPLHVQRIDIHNTVPGAKVQVWRENGTFVVQVVAEEAGRACSQCKQLIPQDEIGCETCR